MQRLTRNEACDFVRQRARLFALGAERNPFCSSQWVLHFLDQVARDDWTVMVPVVDDAGASLMMLYAAGQSRRLSALTNYYASLYSPIIGGRTDSESAAALLVGQIAE